MPKNKHRKDHKKHLQNYKNKIKQQMSQNNGNNVTPPQLPPVRNVPVWDPQAKIEVFGYEWEALFNSIANLQILQQAANSIMSRNVVNGTIGMDFQKLDPATLQYGEMTAEEKAPYIADFAKVIEQMRNPTKASIPTEAVATPRTEEAAESNEASTDASASEGKVVNMFAEGDAENAPTEVAEDVSKPFAVE